MSLIIDEYSHALHLLEFGFSDYMNWEDLLILAKYYRHTGESTQGVKKRLLEYSKKFNPEFNDIIFLKKIENAVRESKKQNIKIVENIFVTKDELDAIRKINNYKYEKVLFIMLLISRGEKIANNKLGTDYYVNKKFSTILTKSKTYMRKDERNNFKNLLFKLGLIISTEPIKIPRKKIDSFKLLFINEDSEKILWINDFENIHLSYPFYCEVCRKMIEKNGRNQKMCDDCWKEKHRKNSREWKRK